MFESNHMLLHLITLCIGLIIAFGLQQIVDLYLRRRRARRQEAASQAPNDTNETPPPSPHDS